MHSSVPIAIGTLMWWSLIGCQTAEAPEQTLYWGHGDSVSYVGIATCAGCHHEIASEFAHTGMGKSFGPATPKHSAADFSRNHLLTDSATGLSYHVAWRDGRLELTEFLLDGKDTLHRLRLAADYIIGSGHHTNSHLVSFGGFLYQMPFTFYTQKGKLDLPPGFEHGANSRFNRLIGLECMSCHNAMPTKFVMGSENKFASVPGGIDCERCHGPGSAHVAKIQRGMLTDTARDVDYSIVNPKKLPAVRKMELCQRCHLQGNAVLADGKSFMDFRPGMMLHAVMDVYLPRYEDDPSFIMASHADRLKQSACFLGSKGKLDCTTCHNPHKSVRQTNINVFNEACQSCHNSNSCTAPRVELDAQKHQCVSCHMPVSGTEDIPHVTVHDHKIGKPMSRKEQQRTKRFVGLHAVNNPSPSVRSKVRAYLQQYERFEPESMYLDSVAVLLAGIDREHVTPEWVNYWYLSGKYAEFTKWFGQRNAADRIALWRTQSYDNLHAWTCAKAAAMLDAQKKFNEAEACYRQAVTLAPEVPAIRQKWANFLARQGRLPESELEYRAVLQQQPMFAEAAGNLGWVRAQQGAFEDSDVWLRQAVAVDPFYLKARLNLIQRFIQDGRWNEALTQLKQAERLFPGNPDLMELRRRWGMH